MKYKVVVKFRGKGSKTTNSETKDLLKILEKHPEAKEVIIDGKIVWKK